jgi:4-hydroxy-4-methyl-2-oxoglutarate aldolase
MAKGRSYEIVADFERPSADLIEKAKDLYVCLVGGEVGPRYTMDPGIKPLEREWRVCGPAVTVRPEHTDDVLMSMFAGKYIKPGDVLVVDAGGDTRAAAFGASMANGIREVGGVGIIVDGYVLTSEIIRKRENIPVFCRGTIARSNKAERPGWINVPAICGGVIVNPGDLILGDEDGVVVVPKDWIADIVKETAGDRKDGAKRPEGGKYPAREEEDEPYYARRKIEDKLKNMDRIIWR